MLDMLNRSLSGDDDDGENLYDNLPDHIKSHYMIFMGEKEPVFKIPLPWGYNVLHTFGQQIGELLSGGRFDVMKSTGRMAGSIIDAFNPVGSSTLLQTISPTILDPLVQIGENKDWAGRPLKPDGSPFGPADPNYLQHWSSSREASNVMAKFLNDISGGDSVRPGSLNVSPEWIDVFVDFFTGSAGRVAADSANIVHKAVSGQDIEAREIPMVRKLYGYDNVFGIKTRYFDWSNDVQIVNKQLNELPPKERVKLYRDPRVRLIQLEKSTRTQLQQLRKQKKAYENAGVSEAAIEAIDNRMRYLMARFNRNYAKMVIDNR